MSEHTTDLNGIGERILARMEATNAARERALAETLALQERRIDDLARKLAALPLSPGGRGPG